MMAQVPKFPYWRFINGGLILVAFFAPQMLGCFGPYFIYVLFGWSAMLLASPLWVEGIVTLVPVVGFVLILIYAVLNIISGYLGRLLIPRSAVIGLYLSASTLVVLTRVLWVYIPFIRPLTQARFDWGYVLLCGVLFSNGLLELREQQLRRQIEAT